MSGKLSFSLCNGEGSMTNYSRSLQSRPGPRDSWNSDRPQHICSSPGACGFPFWSLVRARPKLQRVITGGSKRWWNVDVAKPAKRAKPSFSYPQHSVKQQTYAKQLQSNYVEWAKVWILYVWIYMYSTIGKDHLDSPCHNLHVVKYHWIMLGNEVHQGLSPKYGPFKKIEDFI